nr:MAG: capsid protein [Virus sp.]
MRVINANTEKAHYIVQRTKRVSTVLNRTGFDEVEFNTSSDFELARDYCVKNSVTNTPMDKEKLHIRSMVMDLFLTNPTNVCTYVDLYEVTPKYLVSDESVYNTPVKWLNNINLYNNNFGQPSFNQMNLGTNQMAFGSSIFQVPQFFQKFKIKRKTRMLLQPGECHTRQIRWSKDFIWNPKQNNSIQIEAQNVSGPQPLETNTAVPVISKNPAYLKNIQQNNKKTRYLLFHIWGQPVNDNTTKTTIGTSSCAINIVYTIDYCVSQLPYVRNNQVAPNNVWFDNNLGNVITPVAFQEFNAPLANPTGPT